MRALSISLMLFDHFRCPFAILARKWYQFDRFYKVFRSTFLDAPKCSRANVFDISQSRKTQSTFTGKPNASLTLLRAISRKDPQKYKWTTGFIRYFDQPFWTPRNVVLPTFFDVWQSRKTPSTFTEKPNAFLILLRAMLQKWTQKSP